MAAQNKPPQNLSPDLKQIYDRVMNMPSKGNATPPPPNTPQQPASTPPPPATTPQPTPGASVNPTPPPPPTNPTIPAQPPVENPEPFLTSSAPRPLQGSIGVKSFAMGKENKSDSKVPSASTGDKKGMSKLLIIILILVFFAAWSFFWIVFFFNPFS